MQELDPQNNPYLNPYAAPESRILSPPPLTQQDELADRGMRLAAHFIDIGFYLAAIIPGVIIMVFAASSNDDVIANAGILVMFAGLLGFGIYNCVLLHRNAQTLGKKLMRIKIVRVDGSRAGLMRILFLRGLPIGILNAIPLIGYIFALVDPLMIFRNDQRCLHDLIADTIVIKA